MDKTAHNDNGLNPQGLVLVTKDVDLKARFGVDSCASKTIMRKCLYGLEPRRMTLGRADAIDSFGFRTGAQMLTNCDFDDFQSKVTVNLCYNILTDIIGVKPFRFNTKEDACYGLTMNSIVKPIEKHFASGTLEQKRAFLFHFTSFLILSKIVIISPSYDVVWTAMAEDPIVSLQDIEAEIVWRRIGLTFSTLFVKAAQRMEKLVKSTNYTDAMTIAVAFHDVIKKVYKEFVIISDDQRRYTHNVQRFISELVKNPRYQPEQSLLTTRISEITAWTNVMIEGAAPLTIIPGVIKEADVVTWLGQLQALLADEKSHLIEVSGLLNFFKVHTESATIGDQYSAKRVAIRVISTPRVNNCQPTMVLVTEETSEEAVSITPLTSINAGFHNFLNSMEDLTRAHLDDALKGLLNIASVANSFVNLAKPGLAGTFYLHASAQASSMLVVASGRILFGIERGEFGNNLFEPQLIPNLDRIPEDFFWAYDVVSFCHYYLANKGGGQATLDLFPNITPYSNAQVDSVVFKRIGTPKAPNAHLPLYMSAINRVPIQLKNYTGELKTRLLSIPALFGSIHSSNRALLQPVRQNDFSFEITQVSSWTDENAALIASRKARLVNAVLKHCLRNFYPLVNQMVPVPEGVDRNAFLARRENTEKRLYNAGAIGLGILQVSHPQLAAFLSTCYVEAVKSGLANIVFDVGNERYIGGAV